MTPLPRTLQARIEEESRANFDHFKTGPEHYVAGAQVLWEILSPEIKKLIYVLELECLKEKGHKHEVLGDPCIACMAHDALLDYRKFIGEGK